MTPPTLADRLAAIAMTLTSEPARTVREAIARLAAMDDLEDAAQRLTDGVATKTELRAAVVRALEY